MRSNYKKLGPFIRQIDIRNLEGKEDNLLGVSTQKFFIPSIANTYGTDFTKYKVVKKNQFTYVPDTSRRGDKIGLAMLTDYNQAIVSQAYTVFEVIDHNELDPEYLMMWFRRTEFDRYARYKSHGSVREVFDWDEMCEVELPVPPIEKQRAIVKEYNTVVNRIKLNEQLNQKLEETAQALYKHWFVDFEFPISKKQATEMGKPELEGKPYKSSGGEMVWNEELGKEVPEGWEVLSIGKVIKYKKGNAFKSSEYTTEGIPVVRVSDLTNNSVDFFNCYYISEEKARYFKDYKISNNDIIITTVGSWPHNPDSVVGKVVKVPSYRKQGLLNQNMVRLRTINPLLQNLLFIHLNNKDFLEFVVSGAQGSANQASVTLDHIFSYKIILPKNLVNVSDIHIFSKLIELGNNYESEIMSLKCLSLVNLLKLTKIDIERELV